jgi:hypothetical protein
MSDTAIERSSHDARAFLEGEGLPFPPMPAPMAAKLSEIHPHVFATRAFEDTPYDIEVFENAAFGTEPIDDYALVGVDGHGFNSWALHYFLVENGLALFLQLPWGGAFGDPEKARANIVAAFDWAGAFQDRVHKARAAGQIPAGWRLVVVVSRYAEPGFGWVSPNGEGDSQWTATQDVWEAVDTALARLASGETRLG